MPNPKRFFPLALAAGLLFGGATLAPAQDGNANASSGLSPGASATGNDRSAGVNNGNYRPPGSYGTRRSLRSGFHRSRRLAPHRRRHR